MALTYSPRIEETATLPHFQSQSLNGNLVDSQELMGNKPIWVMFICNHCPYVKAIEDRLIKTAEFILNQGGKVVAICSNDPQDYPEDNPIKLLQRAKEKSYPFPYIFDETQELAKAFGAVCTPDLFLYNGQGKLIYRGQLDNSWKDRGLVSREDLKLAFLSEVENKALSFTIEPAMGCSIKWKK